MTNTAHTPTPRPAGLRAGDQVQTAAELQEIWDTDPRWDGVERTYSAEDVIRIRGSVREEATLAHRGADNLWNLLHTEDYVRALGAYTGGQAVQQVRAGLKAIYLSGWQVAADGNLAGQCPRMRLDSACSTAVRASPFAGTLLDR